jgi:hypothetical protein
MKDAVISLYYFVVLISLIVAIVGYVLHLYVPAAFAGGVCATMMMFNSKIERIR